MVNETCDHLDFYLWRVFNNFVVEEQTYGHPHVPPTQFLDEGKKMFLYSLNASIFLAFPSLIRIIYIYIK